MCDDCIRNLQVHEAADARVAIGALHESPWLPHFHRLERQLTALRPVKAEDELRRASRAAAKALSGREQQDETAAREERAEGGTSAGCSAHRRTGPRRRHRGGWRARARVLSVTRTPQISDLASARRIETLICANYGLLGRRVAAYCLEQGSRLRTLYDELLADWARSVGTADTRLLSNVAILSLEAQIAHAVGFPKLMPSVGIDSWVTVTRDSLADSVKAADQADRALGIVRDELARHRASYLGQEARDRMGVRDVIRDMRGVWRDQDDFVGIFPTVLRGLLEEAKHDVAPVLALWAERGVLAFGGHGLQREVKVDGHKVRVYPFTRASVI